MALDLLREKLGPRRELVQTLSQLKHLKILLRLAEALLPCDFLLNLGLEVLQLHQGLSGEVFGGWFVLLHALKMLDDVLSLCLLFIDDGFQLVVLLVDFLEHLFLQAFLAHHSILHIRARLEGLSTLRENRLELRYLS